MSTHVSRRGWIVVGGLAGLALFGVTLRAVSAAAIFEMVRRVGTAFLWILLLAGLRMAARAAAWTACAGGNSRLPFGSALGACVVGEGVGNLTPLGLAASEPAKVLWVRAHLDTVEAAASLAVETLLYSLAVAVMLVGGALAWVAAAAPASGTRVLVIGLVGCAGVAAGAWLFGRRRGGVMGALLRWLDAKALTRPRLRGVADGLRRTVEILANLLSREPRTLVTVSLLQVAFQAAAVGEVWVTLVLLGVPQATFLHAFLLEFANRVVTVVFKFVPMRLGVDELASGATASLLGSGGTVGVTLAVVRKARVLCWSLVGLALAGVRAIASRGEMARRAAVAERADGLTS